MRAARNMAGAEKPEIIVPKSATFPSERRRISWESDSGRLNWTMNTG